MEGEYHDMTTVSDILRVLDEKAPCGMKLDFDNVGLLVGHAEAPVTRVLTALDITDEVIGEARNWGAELIVSHHPLIFTPVKTVTDATWVGRRILTLAENHMSAICMHTNLDAAQGGVNDALMAALGGTVTETLDPISGIGRIGTLPAAMPFSDFRALVKKALCANGLRYHDAQREVRHIACCGGSGGGEIALAVEAGCDTYVTADVKYDQFLEAKNLGINLIDADHFCTENVVVPVLVQWLHEAFPALELRISKTHAQTVCFD